MSKITTAADDFEAAMTAQRPGDEASTTAKNNARQLLEDLLFAQSVACASIAAGDVAVYQTTGYAMRHTPTKTTAIASPDAFMVEAGMAGQLVITRHTVPSGCAYEIMVGTTADNMAYYGVQSGRRMFINGLIPGTMYYIAFRAVGPNNLVSDRTHTVNQRSL